MSEGPPREAPTALANAQARFRDGLPRRGLELITLSERARGGDASVEEELGRRVHALYATAEVFHDDELTRASRDVARLLDLAREQSRPLGKLELSAVRALASQLGAIAPERTTSSDRPPQPVAVNQTLAGAVVAPDVIAVLLVGGAEVESAVRAALPAERCELTTSRDLEVALEVVDQVAPDIVLIEAVVLEGGLFGGMTEADAISTLRGERNAASRAIALIIPAGAKGEATLLARTRVDAVLRLPLASGGLLERLHRFALGEPTRKLAIDTLSNGTVEQIAAGIAEQVRRGILDSVRQGREECINLGDQAELLAATWSAVSRIRAHLSDVTDGRVRFESRLAEGPAALALTDPQAADRYVGLEDPLRGRRILIADDDPAVVWFFAGLLREAGAIVVEASDGQSALELARKRPPDLLVSDILMPGVDGFALCRELRRDLALAHVPVILISWKEDFLQRMRELDAGAAGYLRKEAGSHQILSTVAQVLAPRTELEILLASDDEVRGRIDVLGAERLLWTVAMKRPNARIAVRDAFNLFEVDVRAGSRIAVTRTATDGTFSRGRAALRQLVGVSSGRYTVSIAEGTLRNAFSEPFDKVLGDAVRDLGALLDAVSDAFLLRVERVLLDDEVLSALLSVTPTELAEVAARLRSAEPVSRLVLSGRWSARELEEHLRELVRRGALVAVQGPSGEDLAAEAREARDRDPGSLLHTSSAVRRSTMPPPTTVEEAEVDWVEEQAAGGQPFDPHAVDEHRALDAALAVRADALLWSSMKVAGAVFPSSEPDPLRAHADTLADPVSRWEPLTAETYASEAFAAEARQAADSTAPDAEELEDIRELERPDPRTRESRPSDRVRDIPRASDRPAAGFNVRSRSLDATPIAKPRTQARALPADPRDPFAVRFAWLLIALVAIGYVGWSWARPKGVASNETIEQVIAPAPHAPAQPPVIPPVIPAVVAAKAIAPGSPAGAAAKPSDDTSASETVEFGRVLPFIDTTRPSTRNITVAPTQGLLVIEADPGSEPTRVKIAGKDRGAAPLALALDPGRHELTLLRASGTSFRYLVIRTGETRVVSIHPFGSPTKP